MKNGSAGITTYDLQGWRAMSGNDVSSKEKPMPISKDRVRFEYNSEKTIKEIKLGASYYDITSQKYVDKITLNPFTAAVLIRAPN